MACGWLEQSPDASRRYTRLRPEPQFSMKLFSCLLRLGLFVPPLASLRSAVAPKRGSTRRCQRCANDLWRSCAGARCARGGDASLRVRRRRHFDGGDVRFLRLPASSLGGRPQTLLLRRQARRRSKATSHPNPATPEPLPLRVRQPQPPSTWLVGLAPSPASLPVPASVLVPAPPAEPAVPPPIPPAPAAPTPPLAVPAAPARPPPPSDPPVPPSAVHAPSMQVTHSVPSWGTTCSHGTCPKAAHALVVEVFTARGTSSYAVEMVPCSSSVVSSTMPWMCSDTPIQSSPGSNRPSSLRSRVTIDACPSIQADSRDPKCGKWSE